MRPTPDLADVLAPWCDPERLSRRLGFRAEDATDTVALLQGLDAEAGAQVAELQQRLLGCLDGVEPPEPVFARSTDARLGGRNVAGGLALAALVAGAEAVHTHHRGRGVGAEQSWRSLSDLGQQVWVHRRTTGEFGLHTQGWLTAAWSGTLHWLGRLQHHLEPVEGGAGQQRPRHQISVHIPESGPLTAAAVTDSMAQATALFARCFPERPASRFHCSSWLLDPVLAEQLPGSNLAGFQQRWTPTGGTHPGDGDAVFFTFRRRIATDEAGRAVTSELAGLPRDTRLQRLVLDRVAGPQGWRSVEGTAPLDLTGPGTGSGGLG